MMETESIMAEMPGNIEAVCRLCLSERMDSLKSIFDPALTPNRLPFKIHQLIQIQVTRNDKLSTMVCNDCIIRLDTWFSYKKQCHRNQTKLAEWLSKSTGQNILDVNIQIKSEPLDIDVPRHGLPIKLEYPVYPDMMQLEYNEFEGNDSRHTMPHYPHNTDHLYLEDLQRGEVEETEATSLKCPECGKSFGSVQNRRRHQNMQHRKDKRAQMMEIRKPAAEFLTVKKFEPITDSTSDEKLDQTTGGTAEENSELTTDNTADVNSEMKIGAATDPTDKNVEQTIDNMAEPRQASSGDTEQNSSTGVDDVDITMQNVNNPQKDTSPSNMDTTPLNMNLTEGERGLNDHPNETTSEDKPKEEASLKNNEEPPSDNTENVKDISKENHENTEISEDASKEDGSSEETQNEKPVELDNNDQQKIEFAAGLKLVQRDSTHIEFEPLSKTELSYIEKCKAMVSMFHSLQCACHNVQHKSLRHLLSHLREIRVWFPLFTCYSCMISFTDRSTFTRHHCRCPKSQLETLIKLSNLRKRSEIKTRLYQNYKCNRCKFLYSFHEDFCKHINEDHDPGAPPIYCSCRTVFDSVEEYKNHCYTSCVLSYYCDICFITTVTLDEFVKHCQEIHDTSEGFLLLQEDSYTPRPNYFRQKEVDEEHNVVEGKRERRKSVKEPILVQVYDNEIPPDPKDIPTRLIRQLVKLEFTPTTAAEWNRTPTKCPVCQKEYSSVNNMVRHYRTHIEKKEVEIPFPLDDGEGENEDLYSCPECGGMYPSSKWKKHIEEKHPPVSCLECDKVFQFQSELDQHRSVHLNLKVYRDSKTHSYKTAVISPGSETNGIVSGIMVMCEICDSMFKSKEELKHHKLTQHDISNMSRASSSMENFEAREDNEEPSNMDMDMDDEVDSKAGITDYSLDVKLPCDACGNLYASAKSLREHVINKHGSSFIKKNEYPKKCDYCDKVCTTGAGLALHTQVHERYNPDKKSEYPKKCEYCDKICTTGAGLYLHTQMHERMTLGDIKKEKTGIGKAATVKSEVIIKEMKQEIKEEEESYHTCKRCFKVFGTKGKLKDHMKSHGIHHSKPVIKKNRKTHCDLCHIAVESNEALSKHKAEEHSDELDGMPTLKNELEDEHSAPVVYTCDVCVETFDSKLELQEHKETHEISDIVPKTKNTLIYCKYCKIAFSSVNELTKHMHVEHGESAKPKVTKDKLGDNSEKPFKCSICAKAFATHGAMTAHFGWHKRSGGALEVGDRRANTSRGTAQRRMVKKVKVLKKIAQAAANNQEPIEPPEFQCTTCLMELPNDTALQIHILEKHRGLDSLMLIPRCDTCNQDFVTQEEYETHKRFHDFLIRQKKHEQQQLQTPIIQSVQSVVESPQNSPKRHPCSWCPSAFSRSDTLNTHIKQNHKEHVKTEFECTQCERVFDKQNSLTIHLKVHEKQKNAAAISIATAVTGGGSGVSASGKVYSCSICNQGFSFPKDLRMHTINAHPF